MASTNKMEDAIIDSTINNGASHAWLAFLKGCLENSPDAVEIDTTDGNIIWVNLSWSKTFGRHLRDVNGASWEGVFTDRHVALELQKTWERCLEKGTSQGQFSFHEFHNEESTVVYMRILVQDSVDSAPPLILTIFKPMDRTAVAYEASSLLVTLLNENNDAAAVIDTEGSLLASNRLFAHMTGYDFSTSPEINLEYLISGAGYKLTTTKKESTRWDGKVSLLHNDGYYTPAWMNVNTVKDDRKNIIGYVLSFRPIFDEAEHNENGSHSQD